MLIKVTLRTYPPLTRCPALACVTRSSLCKRGLRVCQFVCLFVFLTAPFFSAPSMPLILRCWHGMSGGEPSL